MNKGCRSKSVCLYSVQYSLKVYRFTSAPLVFVATKFKDEQDFPSPEQFVRGNFKQNNTDESDAEALNKLASVVGGMINKSKTEAGGLDLSQMASMMSGLGAGNRIQAVSDIKQFLPDAGAINTQQTVVKTDWHRGYC